MSCGLTLRVRVATAGSYSLTRIIRTPLGASILSTQVRIITPTASNLLLPATVKAPSRGTITEVQLITSDYIEVLMATVSGSS